MKKMFIEKIKREGVVDTKKYRYAIRYNENGFEVIRLELYKLDTTAAYTDWVVVKDIRLF